MKPKVTIPILYLVLSVVIIFTVLPGCNNDDEPSIPSSEHITTDLMELMNQIPMNWGSSISQIKDAMESLNLSDFHQASSPASSIMYENENTSMYIVYGFENNKLYSVLIVFPRNEDLDFDTIFSNYLYLGCVTEATYADPENNRLISIYPSHVRSSYPWSAIGFTMIDDE